MAAHSAGGVFSSVGWWSIPTDMYCDYGSLRIWEWIHHFVNQVCIGEVEVCLFLSIKCFGANLIHVNGVYWMF